MIASLPPTLRCPRCRAVVTELSDLSGGPRCYCCQARRYRKYIGNRQPPRPDPTATEVERLLEIDLRPDMGLSITIGDVRCLSSKAVWPLRLLAGGLSIDATANRCFTTPVEIRKLVRWFRKLFGLTRKDLRRLSHKSGTPSGFDEELRALLRKGGAI